MNIDYILETLVENGTSLVYLDGGQVCLSRYLGINESMKIYNYRIVGVYTPRLDTFSVKQFLNDIKLTMGPRIYAQRDH